MTDFPTLISLLAKNKIERLIQVKRAAGRPKDFETIAELETILEERKGKAVSPGVQNFQNPPK